jgi:hypothetical protein
LRALHALAGGRLRAQAGVFGQFSKGVKMVAKSLVMIAFAAFTLHAYAQNAYRVSKTVDTGSHTCIRQGQEVKVYDVAEAPSDRFFVESTVRFSEKSRFGAGNCSLTNDGGKSVEKKTVTLKLANGQTVRADVPVKYYLRAFADCTNNLGKLGSRIGTECVFSGETDEFQ